MHRRSLVLLVGLQLAACGAASTEAGLDAPAVPQPPAHSNDEASDTMNGFSWVVERRLAGMPVPGRARPLERDLAYLSGQRIALLVSLTERPIDPAALATAGIELLHLPVADFTAPSLAQLTAFLDAARQAHAAGRAVGVHCTAGLGRTGTFLAAYFVSEGMSAEAAIAEVRRLRPGSVETREQEERLAELAASLAD